MTPSGVYDPLHESGIKEAYESLKKTYPLSPFHEWICE